MTTQAATSSYFCPRCGTRRGTGGACDRDHADLVAITPSSLLGTEVGNYVLVQRLGEGGMGAVYRAVQPTIGAEVAIKVLHASPGSQAQRFLLEAQAVNRVRHPNLIRILDTGYLSDRRPYLVMELLDGMPLSDAVGTIPPIVAARVATEVLDALEAVHREGIVHRDLKPPNVFLASDGRVVVLDFGIAKLVDGEVVTHSSGLVGTPEYMAPEQIRAQAIDRRTDVYAIGVMLYETITGRRPFAAAATFDMLVQHLEQPPTSPREFAPNLSLELTDVILRAMEKRPEARFQTAADMADALRATTVATRDDLAAFVGQRARTRPPAVSLPAESETARERPTASDRPAVGGDRAARREASEVAPPPAQPRAPVRRGVVAFLPHLAIGAALAGIAAYFVLRGDDRERPPASIAAGSGAGSGTKPTTAAAVTADASIEASIDSPTVTASAEASCMRLSTRMRECTDVFVPALVGWRVELDVPPGVAAIDRKIGRAKNVAGAMKEWWDTNSDAQFAEACAEDSLDPTSAYARAGVDYEQRCTKTSDCAAFVTCIEPLERMRIAATAKPKPTVTKGATATATCDTVAKHASALVHEEWQRVHGGSVSTSESADVYAKIVANCRRWTARGRACVLRAKTYDESNRCEATDELSPCETIAKHATMLVDEVTRRQVGISASKASMAKISARLLYRCQHEWNDTTRTCVGNAPTSEVAALCGNGVLPDAPADDATAGSARDPVDAKRKENPFQP